MVYRDTVKVMPTGVPTSLELTSVKERMLGSLNPNTPDVDGGLPGTPLRVTFLDQYGNPTVNDPVDPTNNMGRFDPLNPNKLPVMDGPIVLPTELKAEFGYPTTIRIIDANNVANNEATGIYNDGKQTPKGVVELAIRPGRMSSEPVTGDEWLGNAPGELLATTGIISLSAEAMIPVTAGDENNPAVTLNTLKSDTVGVNVKTEWLQVDPIFEEPPRAGDDYDAVRIRAYTSTGQVQNPGRTIIQNVSTGEESEADPNISRSGIVEARFTQATILGSQESVLDNPWHVKTHKWFLVSDENGLYSQVLYEAPWGIGTNAGVSMKLYDAHGPNPSETWEKTNDDGTITVVEDGSLTKNFLNSASRVVEGTETVIPEGPEGRGDIKTLVIPEFAFKMTDCFGNPVTVDPEPVVLGDLEDEGTGTFSVKSPNATSVLHKGAEGGNFGIPYRDYFIAPTSLERTNVSLTYDTDLFKGDDRIAVRFTKPGLVAGPCRGQKDASVSDTGADPFEILVTVGTAESEQLLVANPMDDALKLPVNCEAPLTVESLIEDGEVLNEDGTVKQTLYRLFSDAENLLVNMSVNIGENEITWMPDIRELRWRETEFGEVVPPSAINIGNWVAEETPVSSGEVLDFTTHPTTGTNGRKVLVVHCGPVPRKPFTLTFNSIEEDAEGNPLLSVSRTIEVVNTVAETLNRECSEEYRFACETEEACSSVNGEWLVNTEQCEDPDVACEDRLGIFVDGVCYESDPDSGKAEKANRLAAASSIDPEYGGKNSPETMFSGGLLNRTQNSKVFESGSVDSPVVVKLNDQVVTAGVLKVQPEDIGKRADLVVGAFHESPRYIYADPSLDGGAWYMLANCPPTDDECPSTGWEVEEWPMDDGGYPILSELEPLETVTLTDDTYTVTMYEGNFYYTGPLWIYFGYIVELDDPEDTDQPFKVVFNEEPIYVNIEK
jgi:hypothetical protein